MNVIMDSIPKFVKCILILCLCNAGRANPNTKHKVTCTKENMLIQVEKPDNQSTVYLHHLKYYPETSCHPTYEEPHKAVFNLSLNNFSSCGIMRTINHITGTRSYRHKIVIDGTNYRDVINVKCTSRNNHIISRREVLPVGFSEQDDIELTTTIENYAPEPVLNIAVKQGNSPISGELNVKPGTPLTMEIFLDKESAPIYGLLVSFMRVWDTKIQEETIIFNGCAVDPYLFENFNTDDGDLLRAKFRAFKFPETTYVQFTGTVNICLDKCKGIECSNGQIGYGRRKREISGIPYDPRKVFEVTLTAHLKVN